jgi:predicted HD superfamily hydrolase involved in NAD metabolism
VGGKSQERALRKPSRRSARGDQRILNYHDLARGVKDALGQEHRYAHSARVARCAELLAYRYRADTRKARVAGLLHDVARLCAPQHLLDECAKRGMPIDDAEKAAPVLLHARLGAEIARERFGVDDPEILSAIAKHTTADPQMSPLDCAVYLADALEPGRGFSERAALWELALVDMNAAMRGTLASTLGYLHRRGLPIALKSLAAARAFGVET